ELSWEEAADAARADAIALVPIGATEAHGPHLPLATDVIISDELAGRAGEELAGRGRRTVIAPSLAYAVTEYAAGFGGTVSIAAAGAPRAYFGDPAAASAAEGDAIYALLVAMVVAVVDETFGG